MDLRSSLIRTSVFSCYKLTSADKGPVICLVTVELLAPIFGRASGHGISFLF